MDRALSPRASAIVFSRKLSNLATHLLRLVKTGIKARRLGKCLNLMRALLSPGSRAQVIARSSSSRQTFASNFQRCRSWAVVRTMGGGWRAAACRRTARVGPPTASAHFRPQRDEAVQESGGVPESLQERQNADDLCQGPNLNLVFFKTKWSTFSSTFANSYLNCSNKRKASS